MPRVLSISLESICAKSIRSALFTKISHNAPLKNSRREMIHSIWTHSKNTTPIYSIWNHLLLTMENQDQQNSGSQNCAICYSDFKVPYSESGQTIYIPFSPENEYLWTQLLHPGCTLPPSLICLPCIKTRLAMLVDDHSRFYCTACSMTGLDVEMVLQLLPEAKRDVVFMLNLKQNGLKKCYNKACDASFIFEVCSTAIIPIFWSFLLGINKLLGSDHKLSGVLVPLLRPMRGPIPWRT
jgi:hypothetical protein